MKRFSIIKMLLMVLILMIGFNTKANAKTDLPDFKKNELLISGTDSQSIVYLIVGDGFTVEEQDLFNQKADEIKDYILSVEPFDKYSAYTNFYSINVISNESGVSSKPENLKDTYFQCSYNISNIERLLAPNNSKVYALANEYVPYYDNIIMIANHQKYGGSGGNISVTSLNASSYEILVHEMGHSIGDLKDEYWSGIQYAGEGYNMTQENNPVKVPWSDLIGTNGIGVYPFKEDPTWFRPHEGCKMQYLGTQYPFCDVCERALAKSLDVQKWTSNTLKAQYDLLNQVHIIMDKKTLYVGGTIDKTVQIKLKLPKVLNEVDELKPESLTEDKIEVTFQYETGDQEVATVSKNGKITAKGAGATTIYVTATLEGDTTEYIKEIDVVVKKASIKITKAAKSIKLGKSFNFNVKVMGFSPSDVTWSANKKILSINKKTGKATAKSIGKAVVSVKADKFIKKVNVNVIK